MRAGHRPFLLIPFVVLLASNVFPPPRGFVNDFAGVLDPAARARLESRLTTYAAETTNEITIAIFSSLNGRSINDVGVKLFEEWKIGKRGRDNGILLVVGLSEHQVRLDVGYGLEGKVPDAQAGRIIREILAPAFRQNRYADGLERAVEELIRLSGSPTTVPPPARRRPPTAFPFVGPAIAALGIFLLSYLGQRSQMRCPRCNTILQRADSGKGSTAGSRTVRYVCPKCGYQENVLAPASSGPLFIPIYGGHGWGSGGFGGGGGGGFSGFGGGGSGGGGASGSW